MKFYELTIKDTETNISVTSRVASIWFEEEVNDPNRMHAWISSIRYYVDNYPVVQLRTDAATNDGTKGEK